MIVFGITGGTGAGKSSVRHVLENMGAYWIDCDALYYQMLQPGHAMHRAIEEAFGDVFDDAGGLNRKKLGEVVFGKPEELKRLNHITFDYFQRAVEDAVQEQRMQGRRITAVDGINMIQARAAGQFTCARMVGVLAPENVRLRRIMQRDGISEEYARKRIGAQQPDAFYRENCDAILINDGNDPAAFERQAKELFEQLVKTCEEEMQHGK